MSVGAGRTIKTTSHNPPYITLPCPKPHPGRPKIVYSAALNRPSARPVYAKRYNLQKKQNFVYSAAPSLNRLGLFGLNFVYSASHFVYSAGSLGYSAGLSGLFG